MNFDLNKLRIKKTMSMTNPNVEPINNVELIVKKKKGRPRKDPEQQPILVQETTEPTTELEKKKRGRKKKEVVVEEKKKKKRGRKAQVKFFSSSIRKKMQLTCFQEQDNTILHIDINENDEEPSKNASMQLDAKTDDSLHSFFKKLQVDESVKNDIGELLDNDKNILSDYLESSEPRIDLRELYEKRIDFRDAQDKLLVDKLEILQKDETVVSQFFGKSNENNKSAEKQKEITQEMNRKTGYFELLYDFIHNSQWLEHTDVCCWWCCHTFDTVPIGMPVDFDVKTKKFRVKGVFCSFACMTAHKDKHEKNININSLISYLYKKLTAEPIGTKIQRAPPKETLKMFGGDLTIEEFRNSSTETKVYKLVEYPMIVSRDYIQEVDIANVKNANLKIFDEKSFARVVNLDDQRVQDARTRLSSQIEKTTVTIGNTIDKFISFA